MSDSLGWFGAGTDLLGGGEPVSTDGDGHGESLLGDVAFGWGMLGGDCLPTPADRFVVLLGDSSIALAAPVYDGGTDLLGGFGVGWDMLGGDAAFNSSIPSNEDLGTDLLGDVAIGWDMLGGDGPTPVIITLDRFLQLHGASTIANIRVLTDRRSVLFGGSSINHVTYVSRNIVLHGASSIFHVLVTRHTLLHGASALITTGAVDRIMQMFGDTSLSINRVFDFSLTIALTTPRASSVDADQHTTPLPTYFT